MIHRLDLITSIDFSPTGSFIYITYSFKNSKEGIRQRMRDVSHKRAFAAMKLADVSTGIKNENFVSSKENVAEQNYVVNELSKKNMQY